MLKFKKWFINELRKVDTKISTDDVLHKTSIENIVFDKGGLKYPLPVFPSMLNNNNFINCFHVTTPYQFPRLITLQGSKRPISCATTITESLLRYGISGSGLILYLKGNLLLGGLEDLGSVPDENGHRWIDANSFENIPNNKGNSKWLYSLVRLRIIELRESIIQKYLKYISKNPISYIGLGDPEKAKWTLEPKWEHIPNFTSKEILANIIKDYIKESRKIWDEISKFLDLEKTIKSSESSYGWNEVLVNNIKIKFIVITSEYFENSWRRPGDHHQKEQIENLCRVNNIKFYYVKEEEVFNWIKEFTKINPSP